VETLPRAINSALEAGPRGGTEVIVVPKGSSTGWYRVADQFSDNRRVRWKPSARRGVSAARNYGLACARGEFVRFLDDDDYLYPVACRQQYETLATSGADVCSGALDIVRENGTIMKTCAQPPTQDLCVAALRRGPYIQVGCHVYRRTVLAGVQWNEEQSLYEDAEWLIAVACKQELTWVKVDAFVAAWVQHRGARLSRGRDPGAATLRHSAEVMRQAAEVLTETGRFNATRREAFADGLWGLLQKGLRYEPRYWFGVAATANQFMPDRRPPSRIHQLAIAKRMPPLVIEIGLVPIRWMYAPIRHLMDSLGINRV
jgi:glycosyltransferase involved in cell wall biosynthesis